jgi:hypothetical protein
MCYAAGGKVLRRARAIRCWATIFLYSGRSLSTILARSASVGIADEIKCMVGIWPKTSREGTKSSGPATQFSVCVAKARTTSFGAVGWVLVIL